MLHITLGPWKEADPEDGLHRSHVGYREGMSEQEMYRHNHGEWAIGKKRQNTEHYALFSFGGRVVQALEVSEYELTRPFTPADKRDDKYTIHGTPLAKGHPVFDKYVGEPMPVTPGRNPVRYFEDPEFDSAVGKLCRCGCGESTTAGDFVPGHDQRAIHERIARIGTVAEFLDWMDVVRPTVTVR
jgi:hypothetical protein